MENLASIKVQILKILNHPEADEGLYFRNFFLLHEEDERPALTADESEILEALNELVSEGKVKLEETDGEVIFQLAQ